MNCTRARFLLYAYLDRELSRCEADELARHLSHCGPCAARGASARGLARVLRSRLDRTPAPSRLRERLLVGSGIGARPRYPAFAFAAALALLILPLVSDEPGRRLSGPMAASAGMSLAPSGFTLASKASPLSFVSKRITGTFVCLQCETRAEAGLCAAPEPSHQPGFCADNGEVWRLMSVNTAFSQASVGRMATVEGIAFPQSGFLRANRVGY